MRVGLGLNTTIIHHDSGSTLQSQLPAGYTYATFFAYIAAQGIKQVDLFFAAGDSPSFSPRFWIRSVGSTAVVRWPGDGVVTRNANKDITNTHTSGDRCPHDSNVWQILDECQANGIGVCIRIFDFNDAAGDFTHHPLRIGRLNAQGNVDGLGDAGFIADANWYQIFSDATAIDIQKDVITAVVYGLTDEATGLLHPAISEFDLSNEFILWQNGGTYNDTHFHAWVSTMAAWLWTSIPGPTAGKPMIGLSAILNLRTKTANGAFATIEAAGVPADHIVSLMHDYDGIHLIANLQRVLAANYQTHGRLLRITENWPMTVAPNNYYVPDTYVGAELYGDPVAHTGVYDNIATFDYTETDGADRYRHTRWWAWFTAIFPKVVGYQRWWSFMDGYGVGKFKTVIARMAEVMGAAAVMWSKTEGRKTTITDITPFVSSSGSLTHKQVSADGSLIAFFLVGSGSQTINFGVSSATQKTGWTLTLYNWETGAVLSSSTVNLDAVSLDFSVPNLGLLVGVLEHYHSAYGQSLQVTDGVNDGRETSGGVMSLTSTNYGLTAANARLGFRYPGLSIPLTATLEKAYLEVYFPNGGSVTCKGILYLQDIVTAPTMTTTANDLSGRAVLGTSITVDFVGVAGWNRLDVTTLIAALRAAFPTDATFTPLFILKSTTGASFTVNTQEAGENGNFGYTSARVFILYSAIGEAPVVPVGGWSTWGDGWGGGWGRRKNRLDKTKAKLSFRRLL